MDRLGYIYCQCMGRVVPGSADASRSAVPGGVSTHTTWRDTTPSAFVLPRPQWILRCTTNAKNAMLTVTEIRLRGMQCHRALPGRCATPPPLGDPLKTPALVGRDERRLQGKDSRGGFKTHALRTAFRMRPARTATTSTCNSCPLPFPPLLHRAPPLRVEAQARSSRV
jgi:hypothetical protein